MALKGLTLRQLGLSIILQYYLITTIYCAVLCSTIQYSYRRGEESRGGGRREFVCLLLLSYLIYFIIKGSHHTHRHTPHHQPSNHPSNHPSIHINAHLQYVQNVQYHHHHWSPSSTIHLSTQHPTSNTIHHRSRPNLQYQCPHLRFHHHHHHHQSTSLPPIAFSLLPPSFRIT